MSCPHHPRAGQQSVRAEVAAHDQQKLRHLFRRQVAFKRAPAITYSIPLRSMNCLVSASALLSTSGGTTAGAASLIRRRALMYRTACDSGNS
jgi:hypothetical protein